MEDKKEKFPYPCCICGKENTVAESIYCCNGSDCGCMGMPVNGPDVCSDECYNKLMEQIRKKK